MLGFAPSRSAALATGCARFFVAVAVAVNDHVNVNVNVNGLSV
jgi:hypothetical protein